MATEKMRLERVRFIPPVLEPGVLYAAVEFDAAAHLCPCGCGSKVRTPLGQTEWHLEDAPDGPTLYPSIGNWQRPCRSHYWIWEGRIIWSDEWTDAQIHEGRRQEEKQRRAYFRGSGYRRAASRVRAWSSTLLSRLFDLRNGGGGGD